jgi:hypothetical protein
MGSHGVNLSLGSVDDLNERYIRELSALFELIQPPWFSDHLCFTSMKGHYANDLLPLPISEEGAEHCIRKIKQVKSLFKTPFLIENVSTYAEITENGWTEAQWLRFILEEADCGLLLDVNNVYVNARNHGGDPFAFIQSLPLERVVEIHMAGHLETDDLLIDTHGEAIRPEVFDLFSQTIPLCPNLKSVLLERDSNLPPFEELLAELQTLRASACLAGVGV